ncbi:endonuclease/exonuclease/phosphatase family protein [Oryzifoliimicrobium ureilyticus]|uniref:endonuclease/exonuclease/phosphatase family protein n=1 Tax=Oryzifoliimicrobium ureilyticus TaxID=3113724 RepID=UPI0030767207
MEKNSKRSLRASIVASIRDRKKRLDHQPSDRREGTLIATYNVHKCVGIDRRFDPERTSRVIHEIDADVIALQEADTRFGERTGILDLGRLERETGLVPVPISGMAKAHGWHGNVVLFKKGVVRDIHQIDLPGLEPRGALVAELELEKNGILRIIAAHFGLLRHSRARQAKVLIDLMTDEREVPTILVGDLNEWRLGDKSSLHSFQLAFGPQPPAVPSFPARLPMLALDRIIANRRGMLTRLEVHDTPLSRVASDHLPVKAVVDLIPARKEKQSADLK